jgi:hypothetical protein
VVQFEQTAQTRSHPEGLLVPKDLARVATAAGSVHIRSAQDASQAQHDAWQKWSKFKLTHYPHSKINTMTDLIRLGRWFYAVAIAGFGIQFLVHAWFRGPVPGPPWVPGRPLLAYLTSIVLIAAAVSIMTGNKVRWATMLLSIMLLLRAV